MLWESVGGCSKQTAVPLPLLVLSQTRRPVSDVAVAAVGGESCFYALAHCEKSGSNPDSERGHLASRARARENSLRGVAMYMKGSGHGL